jgi:predicted metalloprotease with PDZ domain
VVTKLFKNSPALKIGLHVGYVLTAINHVAVDGKERAELSKMLNYGGLRTIIEYRATRKGEIVAAASEVKSAVVAEDGSNVQSFWESAPASQKRVVCVARQFADEKVGLGVLKEHGHSAVTTVVAGSAAQGAGIVLGDVVIAVNGIPCDNKTQSTIKLMLSKGGLRINVELCGA